MASSWSRRPSQGAGQQSRPDGLVDPMSDRPRVRSLYVEYDAMEQIRRDLQKGAAEAARADRSRRNRARRRRAWIRRTARRAASGVMFTARTSAALARRLIVAIIRRSIWLTRLAGERLLRAASRSKGALPRKARNVRSETEEEYPRVAALEHPTANARDVELAELDRRQLWLREKRLGPDHPDIGVLSLVVARHERSRGERLRARFLYERAFTVTARSLGRDHPDVTAVAHELADLAREAGDLEQAAMWESDRPGPQSVSERSARSTLRAPHADER